MGMKINLPQCAVCHSLIESNAIRCAKCHRVIHKTDYCINLHKKLCRSRVNTDLQNRELPEDDLLFR